MNTHVEEHEKGAVTASDKLEEDPGDHGHDGVVDDMKGGQLVVLLLENHEEGVHKVSELGEEIPPNYVGRAENTYSKAGSMQNAEAYLSPSAEFE